MSTTSKSTLFKKDRQRQLLAENGNLNKLKKTYLFKEKVNPNTQLFWGKKIDKGLAYEEQDQMTKERIKLATEFVNKNSKKILDVGLGYGYFEKKIREINQKIKLYGIDISKISIKKINKTIKGIFKVGPVLKIPFKAKLFDIVVALEIFEHLYPYETFSAFDEIKRVIKEKGQLIISVPVNENFYNEFNPNRHVRAYTQELITAELKIAGFKIKKIKKLYAFKNLYKIKKLLKIIFPNYWQPNVILISAEKL